MRSQSHDWICVLVTGLCKTLLAPEVCFQAASSYSGLERTGYSSRVFRELTVALKSGDAESTLRGVQRTLLTLLLRCYALTCAFGKDELAYLSAVSPDSLELRRG